MTSCRPRWDQDQEVVTVRETLMTVRGDVMTVMSELMENIGLM